MLDGYIKFCYSSVKIIFFNVSGEILLIVGSEAIVLKEGDSFSYPSTVPHRFLTTVTKNP
ncbi:MAG: cupin domain-containing protein [Granulosicoccus sp.]